MQIVRMKKLIFAGLLLCSLQAHAVDGFVLGTVLGASIANKNDSSMVVIDVRTQTLFCEAYTFNRFQEGLCNTNEGKLPIAKYVSKMGYKMYRKRQVVFANSNYYTVLDVWK